MPCLRAMCYSCAMSQSHVLQLCHVLEPCVTDMPCPGAMCYSCAMSQSLWSCIYHISMTFTQIQHSIMRLFANLSILNTEDMGILNAWTAL